MWIRCGKMSKARLSQKKNTVKSLFTCVVTHPPEAVYQAKSDPEMIPSARHKRDSCHSSSTSLPMISGCSGLLKLTAAPKNSSTDPP